MEKTNEMVAQQLAIYEAILRESSEREISGYDIDEIMKSLKVSTAAIIQLACMEYAQSLIDSYEDLKHLEGVLKKAMI